MKKKYFRFNEANQPDQVPGLLTGTHGVEKTAEAMRATGFLVEEVTAKQAARIRQRQARSERLAEKIRQALEAA